MNRWCKSILKDFSLEDAVILLSKRVSDAEEESESFYRAYNEIKVRNDKLSEELNDCREKLFEFLVKYDLLDKEYERLEKESIRLGEDPDILSVLGDKMSDLEVKEMKFDYILSSYM